MGWVARWWRSRLSALSTVVLALVVVASGLLQTGSAQVLSQVLDQNWRGAYDILVRPPGQDLAAASTNGFVEGNFVSVTGSGGISLQQLAAIRKIDGVGVAAPIGLVGQIGYQASAPIVDIPDRPLLHTSALPDHPALYKIGFTVSLTDAGGTRVVASESINAVLRRQTTDITDRPMASDNSASAGWDPENGITFSGPTLPDFSSSVIAVDPQAEMQLLGAGGKFLEPLTQVPADRTASALAGGSWLKSLPAQFAPTTQLFEQAGTDGTLPTQAVPLLINNSPGASMSLKVSVGMSDKKVNTLPDAVPEVVKLADGAAFRPLGSTSKDLTSLLVPFATGNLNVAWPGSAGFKIDQYDKSGSPNLTPQLVGRPGYTVVSGPPGDSPSTPSFRVQPQGLVSIDGTSPIADSTLGGRAAGVQAYRRPVTAPQPDIPTAETSTLPIGSFSIKDLDFGASGISYTPLGAYDAAKTTWLATADGAAADGRQIVPNPSGLDFISPQPGAITDLAGALDLRGKTPIDAIRVRVAGIAGYTPTNQRTVVEVADRIAALGLSVTVVAGASPQPVNVYVPQYKVSSSGTVSDLGWVRQDWTTLGAAIVVQNTLHGLSVLLLIIALLVGAVLYVGVTAADRPRRIDQAHLLITLGWTRPSIAWWTAAPSLVALGLLTAAGVGTGVATRFSAPTVWAALAAVLIAVIGVLLVAATSSPPTEGASVHRQRWAGVGTAFAVGMRQTLTRPAATLVRALSWIVLATAVPLVLVAITDARLRVGATRLAGFALDRSGLADLSLASLTLLAGLLLIALARRVERLERAGQNHTLTGLGWTALEIRRRDLADTAVTTAVAAVPALAIALVLGARSLDLGAPLALSAAAATLLGCAALSVTYRPTRSSS